MVRAEELVVDRPVAPGAGEAAVLAELAAVAELPVVAELAAGAELAVVPECLAPPHAPSTTATSNSPMVSTRRLTVSRSTATCVLGGVEIQDGHGVGGERIPEHGAELPERLDCGGHGLGLGE
jgi:hypothetical protein